MHVVEDLVGQAADIKVVDERAWRRLGGRLRRFHSRRGGQATPHRCWQPRAATLRQPGGHRPGGAVGTTSCSRPVALSSCQEM